MKEIYIKTEYIKLGQFLKFSGFISNGAEAKIFLEENNVLVNNEKEIRRGRKIQENFVVSINNQKFIVKKGI